MCLDNKLTTPWQYPNRAQFKHIVHGPRSWTLAAEAFPGIRDAVEDGDWALAERLVGRAVDVVDSAARALGKFQPTRTPSA